MHTLVRSNILGLVFCIGIYILLIWKQQPSFFWQNFDYSLIERYQLSQDIPTEVPGKRLFLSDSEIHLAAGYLYVTGNDPAAFNFQHPPLGKYAYGFATRLIGRPQYAQLSFGIGLLLTTYILAITVTKQRAVAVCATALLAIDPVMQHVSNGFLLDLPQSFFFSLYLLSLLKSKNAWLHGITLAAVLATKFWGGSLALIAALHFFVLMIQKMSFKKYVQHLAIAVLFFLATYLATFINRGWLFNSIFFQLKVLKYWLHHSVTSIPGASLILFLTGLSKTWWGSGSWVRDTLWFALWPVGLGASVLVAKKSIKTKTLYALSLVCSLPIIHLLYLGVQAPFARYFIMILPYLYIGLAFMATQLWLAARSKK